MAPPIDAAAEDVLLNAERTGNKEFLMTVANSSTMRLVSNDEVPGSFVL
jgi:hypothetical protein